MHANSFAKIKVLRFQSPLRCENYYTHTSFNSTVKSFSNPLRCEILQFILIPCVKSSKFINSKNKSVCCKPLDHSGAKMSRGFLRVWATPKIKVVASNSLRYGNWKAFARTITDWFTNKSACPSNPLRCAKTDTTHTDSDSLCTPLRCGIWHTHTTADAFWSLFENDIVQK